LLQNNLDFLNQINIFNLLTEIFCIKAIGLKLSETEKVLVKNIDSYCFIGAFFV